VSQPVEANMALARRGYELWNEGGVDAWRELWAPEIVFHEAPELPDTGVFHGAEALAAHGRDLIEAVGHFQWKVLSLEGRGDHVLSILEVSVEGASSGAAVTTPFFHVARYEGRQLHELRSFGDGDQARREYERLSASSD
jgi:ketosteroid isomerase-like protein